MALLTHVTFKVSGEPSQLADFDARLKVLFAEQRVPGEIEEQHGADALHYDLKTTGGIPFPPFAAASGEFPELEIFVEWVSPGAGTRGTARIVRGTLAEQHMENVAGTAGADHAVVINLDADGFLALALAVVRAGRDEYHGYALTGRQDALFRVVREPASGEIELFATEGAAEWSRAWRVTPGREAGYRTLDPPQPIEPGTFGAMETLAREFAAGWIWFSNGLPEDIAIELDRYQRLGRVVSDANLRASALHRIKDNAVNADGALHYSTLDAESAWVEGVISGCWAK